jgi:hypothetical protein
MKRASFGKAAIHMICKIVASDSKLHAFDHGNDTSPWYNLLQYLEAAFALRSISMREN